MIVFDIIIFIILIFFSIKGFKNGLIVEIGSFVALIAGFFLTARFSYFIYNLLKDTYFLGSEFLPIISYILTFVIIVISIFFVAKLLTKIAQIIKINWLNKLIGFIFGFLKGILIVGGFFLFIDILITKYGFFQDISFNKSICFYSLLKVIKTIFPVFPF